MQALMVAHNHIIRLAATVAFALSFPVGNITLITAIVHITIELNAQFTMTKKVFKTRNRYANIMLNNNEISNRIYSAGSVENENSV
ncbi:hypothetical protein GCM10007938_40480 [Vibrio zhanjiangensis]|uniref:Uncharacterized protein n=1 Tax=Vibrio zhanjiangensis TaxID=1046128 RepID=A0ABQ6F5Y1_9VIBR|nr:hypothetical protein GCM10007938_40480 [Vibrio zhanjiangensis]